MKIAVPFLMVLLSASVLSQTSDYTRYVNPFIGTGGHGHTFPGATLPFGMVQLSPDTRTDNWDGSSGYHYSDDIIYGFSHTHLSGTGIPDYCDVLLMPMTLPPFGRKAEDKSSIRNGTKFSHANERAEPGYYSVKLDDGLLAELITTPRVGLHRYTFPKGKPAWLELDLRWRDKLLGSQIRLVDNGQRVEGFRKSSSWAKDQSVYFVIAFSRTVTASWAGGMVVDSEEINDKRAVFRFPSDDKGGDSGQPLLVKVAISSVSIEGARKNLAAELPGWDFGKVRAEAKAAWNKELSKIEVSGGTDAQMTTFYTALYHTMIQPNIFNDVDGNYRGHDGKMHNITEDNRRDAETQRQTNPKSKIQNPKSDQYTVFSLWDTFRAAHPLYTIIDQKRTADFINTFIRLYEQGGRLPVWELAGNETDCMIGYHAVSVIADAMAKGIKGFDYDKAYAAVEHSAELNDFGLAAYKKRGYISQEDDDASVSKTLEYAYDDWCIAQMAKIMSDRYEDWLAHTNKMLASGEPEVRYAADYAEYSARARSFENLFDPSTGFMRPKKNGGFISPFAPNEVTFNYTEGNAWVYSFFVPQDVIRLMELQGGPDKFAAKLDELFTTTDKLSGRDQPDITGLIGQYAHGNEPSHHIAYLYDYAGQPWKTQKYVRQILDEFYKPTPDGLIGNEDCGQMSAWYILSASGIYEVTPGSGIYVFGTPLFKEVKYSLENGKTFTIKAPNVSAVNIYIKSATLNGQLYRKAFISHEDLMKGGVLEFEMTDQPVTNAFEDLPASNLTGDFVPVPIIDGKRTFEGSTEVTIRTLAPNTKTYYMISLGENPGFPPKSAMIPYEWPIRVPQSCAVRAIAFNTERKSSLWAEALFHKKPNDWTVSIASKYNRQYTGGGDEGLIDGIRGTDKFASGEWQGYQGQDLIATIDLQKETTVTKVGAGFLQNARSWIWMPTHIEFEVSGDNVRFTKVADIKTDVAPEDMDPKIRDYTQNISPVKARYVRVHAYNLGRIPSWHPGAGSDAHIFVDEIFIS